MNRILISCKIFKGINETIIAIDVKPFVNRIYLITISEKNLVKLYEIDLYYKLIVVLNSFINEEYIDYINLSANPLQG